MDFQQFHFLRGKVDFSWGVGYAQVSLLIIFRTTGGKYGMDRTSF
jgi:hypothetical protein